MSDGTPPQYPPPGAPSEQGPPSAYPPPGVPYDASGHHPPYQPPRPPAYDGMHGAAHKPGAIPLRPLDLGAIYDGAFRIIRFNPKATVGAAVLVTAVANLVPVIVAAVFTALLDVPSFTTALETDPAAVDDSGADLAVGLLYLTSIVGALTTWLGLLFVTGMVAHVAHAAAVGRKLTLGQAWRATRGQRWRLVGLNLVVILMFALAIVFYITLWAILVVVAGEPIVLVFFGLVSGPAFICAMVWLWVRLLYLPVPALMLERTGVFTALGRGYRLSSRQFWRILGIALLTLVITWFASQILATPITVVGLLGALAVPDHGWLIYVVANSLAYVISNAFIAPFTAAVVALQYIDQRMRKEAHDVELMREAGLMDR